MGKFNFNDYNTSSNLQEDGFQVLQFTNKISDNIDIFTKDLEHVGELSLSKDVFRTKLGDIKQIQNLHIELPEWVEVLNQELANLIGATEYKILNNQYFCKPPNYKMTSAHQDNAYFESDENVVTFWIPLQDVDLINSCMFYVPGSHKDGLVKHNPIGTNTRTRTGKTGVSLYSDFYLNKDFVKVPMSYGEILVHDKNCMHFSSPNLSDEYRIAITCIMKIIK